MSDISVVINMLENIHKSLESINQRMDDMEGNLNKRIDDINTSINQRMDNMEDNLNQRINALNEQNASEHKEVVERIYELEGVVILNTYDIARLIAAK